WPRDPDWPRCSPVLPPVPVDDGAVRLLTGIRLDGTHCRARPTAVRSGWGDATHNVMLGFGPGIYELFMRSCGECGDMVLPPRLRASAPPRLRVQSLANSMPGPSPIGVRIGCDARSSEQDAQPQRRSKSPSCAHATSPPS